MSSTPTVGRADSCSSSPIALFMSSMIIWASLCTKHQYSTVQINNPAYTSTVNSTQIQYLPVFPSDSYYMRFLIGQKLFKIFNVLSLWMTDTDSKPISSESSDSLPGPVLYLLLSFFLSEGIPSLHEIRQTQEVNHFSLPVDQSAEHWCISKRKNSTVTFVTKMHWFTCIFHKKGNTHLLGA